MDPNATLAEMLDILGILSQPTYERDRAGAREQFIERLKFLYDWLVQGGFLPIVENPQLHGALARAAQLGNTEGE